MFVGAMTAHKQQGALRRHFRHALVVLGWDDGCLSGAQEFEKYFGLEDDIREIISEIAESACVCHVPDTMKAGVASAICEVVSNVLLHSESESGACVVAEFRSNGEILDMTVYDAGVGFRDKISRREKRDMTAAEAIEWALVEGHTVIEPSRRGPSGLGLKEVVDFIWQNKGILQIATGNARWTFSEGAPRIATLPEEIKGALVKLSFNLQSDYSYSKRVDEMGGGGDKGENKDQT